jgi:small conductance mechanosensitive channel
MPLPTVRQYVRPLPFLAQTTPDSPVAFDLGFLQITDLQIANGIGDAIRIVLVVVISTVVVWFGKRVIRRMVAGVRDPDSGPIDKLKRRGRRLTGIREGEDPSQHLRKVRRAEALGSVMSSILAAVVWTLSVFTILSTVGVELGPYIAGLGIVGVALGFGAQDLVKDFISGVFMLLEDQYGVGDVVNAGDAIGTVEGVSLRTTRIRSVDGTLWYVPNGEIRRLGNMSQEWARALLDISVAYDTDTDHATAVIEEVALGMAAEEEYRGTFLDTPQVWGIENLGADAVDIRLVIKTTPGDQWGVGRELRRRLKQAFDRDGIEIPFPQRTMWLRTEGQNATLSVGDTATEDAAGDADDA